LSGLHRKNNRPPSTTTLKRRGSAVASALHALDDQMRSRIALALLVMSACQTALVTEERQQAIENDAGLEDAGGAGPDADAGVPADAADAVPADADDLDHDGGELAPMWTWRSTGSISSCSGGPGGAGPAAMLIRVYWCHCSQLVKDCTDEDCNSCSNARTVACPKETTTGWLSPIQIPIVNMLPGCYAEELAICETHCRSACNTGCS
jgi:hypothetical protein